MSCERCELEQKKLKSHQAPDNFVYIRVGNGNILVVGCRDHLKQLVEERRSRASAR